MKRNGIGYRLATVLTALFAGAAWGEQVKMSAAEFEKIVLANADVPPVIRTKVLPDYSTNRLNYALMNGLAQTPGGRIWLSWISGGDGAYSFTAGNWSEDGGRTWTDVNLVIDGHDGRKASGLDVGRTNIIGTYWVDPDGKLHLFTDQTLFHFDSRAGVWEFVCANPDDAKPVWSAPRRIANGHVINKPIVLKNGDWLFAAYLGQNVFGDGAPFVEHTFTNLDSERGMVCYASTDRGKTWVKRGHAAFPWRDWQETTLLELKDGRIRAYCRNHDEKTKRGVLLASESSDGGRTWNAPHPLKNMNNTNARFQVLRLKSGRMLYICHEGANEDGGPHNERGRLFAHLSDDDGETWVGSLLIAPKWDSYPDVFQAANGDICVANDRGRGTTAEIRFHRFTEADILAGKLVSPQSKLDTLAFRAMASETNRKRL